MHSLTKVENFANMKLSILWRIRQRKEKGERKEVRRRTKPVPFSRCVEKTYNKDCKEVEG